MLPPEMITPRAGSPPAISEQRRGHARPRRSAPPQSSPAPSEIASSRGSRPRSPAECLSRCWRRIGNVSLPGEACAIRRRSFPAAEWSPARPSRNDSQSSLASSGSTPKIRMPGRIDFAIVAQPDAMSAAADADHQRIEIRNVFEQFERGRALARHDHRMIEGRHQRSAGLLQVRARRSLRGRRANGRKSRCGRRAPGSAPSWIAARPPASRSWPACPTCFAAIAVACA